MFKNLKLERNQLVARFSAFVTNLSMERNELITQFLAIFSNFRPERDYLFCRFLAIFKNLNLVYGYFHKFGNGKNQLIASNNILNIRFR